MRSLCCIALAALVSTACFGYLLHAAQQLAGIGEGIVAIRLLASFGASLTQASNASAPAMQHAATRTTLQPTPNDHIKNGLQQVSGYLPVSALSERPELLKDIDPQWYLLGTDLPVLSALLLINEYGDVDDLVIESTRLSPMLLEDLRIRFLAARFSPGRRDGQPVKVALRIVMQLE